MRIFATTLLLAAGVLPLSSATINVYISEPGRVTPISGATVETFDTLILGNRTVPFQSAIGEYKLGGAVAFNIQAPNEFGGAGETRYMTFGAQSSTAAPIPLEFKRAESYFGFWWSAGDANNRITLYSGKAIVTQFTTSTITTALGTGANSRITAIDGTRHRSREYFGKPGTGDNTGEPYAYVFFAASTPLFTSVVFDNLGATGTGFESDNHAVYRGVVNVPGTSVRLGTWQVDDPIYTPEPATLVLVPAALALIATRRRR